MYASCKAAHSSYIDRLLAAVTLVVTFAVVVDVTGQPFQLPNKPGSLKFAAMGDNGTGDQPQYDVARQMTVAHDVPLRSRDHAR